ncbi:MAG TPA: hypothetical protein VNT52_17350 [Acidimicrobiales bacterium]|nr:hypothetical protein [Acidimicrobiales bacterium]
MTRRRKADTCGAEGYAGEGKKRVRIVCSLDAGHPGPVHVDETTGHQWAPSDETLPLPENA